jgi:hypothetical protein
MIFDFIKNVPDNAKPFVRGGRKGGSLRKTAEPPKEDSTVGSAFYFPISIAGEN